MIIGVMTSAIGGGVAGLFWAVCQHHGISQIVASYPLGGLVAVTTFLSVSMILLNDEGSTRRW